MHPVPLAIKQKYLKSLLKIKALGLCWQQSNNKKPYHRSITIDHIKWKKDLFPDTAERPMRICVSNTDKYCTAQTVSKPTQPIASHR